MNSLRRKIATFALAAFLVAGTSQAALAHGPGHPRGFNDEYVYAATRAVNESDTPPALKVTLFPATIVIDTAFLPFAVLAGFIV